jgi:hypothetical protein
VALVAENERHAAQIAAGTTGRRAGHAFEKRLAEDLNLVVLSEADIPSPPIAPLQVGQPAIELLRYILGHEHLALPSSLEASWLGGLATAGAGDHALDGSGAILTRTKSDVLLELGWASGETTTRGVSVKACNKARPTNAQLYFTTAVGFCALMRRQGLVVSPAAEDALRRFCGDVGFRPLDTSDVTTRTSDPARWYWEELPDLGRRALEAFFQSHQASITRILLREAYLEDPYPPDYLMHQRFRCLSPDTCPLALFSIDDLVARSCAFGGFATKAYVIRKGRYAADDARHLAPRFGFVQFQRAGQRQHPAQLQFNLRAGYFNEPR